MIFLKVKIKKTFIHLTFTVIVVSYIKVSNYGGDILG